MVLPGNLLHRTLLATSAVAAALAVPTAAQAQQDSGTASNGAAATSRLQEVTVTAERRAQSVQKTAISITAISGAKIAATGISSYADVVQNVPGLMFQAGQLGGQPDQPVFAIRGLGQDGLQAQQAVTTFLDGVALNGEGAVFYDVSRVEVLRGPQGTLYGGNAPAGSLSIITNDPVIGKFGGSIQLDVGNYGLVHADGAVNLPINDVLAARVAANVVSRANYAASSAPGQRELSVRTKLLYRPSPDLSVLIGTEQYQYKGNGLDGYETQYSNGQLTGQYYPGLGGGKSDTSKYYGNINWNFGPANLNYIPAFQRFSNTNLFALSLPVSGSNNLHREPYQDELTQELRLTSPADATLSWLVGLYYQKYDNLVHTDLGFTPLSYPPFTPFLIIGTKADNSSRAAFSQATYHVSSRLRVTGGFRYTLDDINTPSSQTFISPPGPPVPPSYFYFSEHFHNLSYLGRIEYDVTPENMLYVLTATGYRPGGSGPAGGNNFSPEKATNYEIGSKNRFFGNRLQINGDIYYTNYPAYQNEAESYIDGVGIGNVYAIPARFAGAELEASALVTPYDQLTASLAYENANYTGDVAINSGGSVGVITTKGGTLPHAPVWNLSGSYNHTFELARGDSLVAGFDARFVSKQGLYFSSCLYDVPDCAADGYANGKPATPGQFIQNGYGLFDASLAYHALADRYTITAYVRNLGDQVYKTGYNFGFGGAGIGAPRTYGMIVAAKF